MTIKHERSSEEWEQFKVMTKGIWRELSDADFEVARGSRDALFEIIVRYLGDSREVIASKIDRAIIRKCAAEYHILGCIPIYNEVISDDEAKGVVQKGMRNSIKP